MEETDLTYAKFEASGITIPVIKLIEIDVHFQNHSKVQCDASYMAHESTTQ